MLIINCDTQLVSSYFHRNAYLRCIRKSKELHYEFFDHVPWTDEPHRSIKEWNAWKLISSCTKACDLVEIITPAGRKIARSGPLFPSFDLQKLNHDIYWEERKALDTAGELC